MAGAERAGSEDSAGVLAIFGENPWAVPVGLVLFSAAIAYLYASTRRKAAVPPSAPEADSTPPPQAAPR